MKDKFPNIYGDTYILLKLHFIGTYPICLLLHMNITYYIYIYIYIYIIKLWPRRVSLFYFVGPIKVTCTNTSNPYEFIIEEIRQNYFALVSQILFLNSLFLFFFLEQDSFELSEILFIPIRSPLKTKWIRYS